MGEVFYCDPAGEAGERWINLSQFARSTTVDALQTQVNALAASITGFATTGDVAALQTQINGLSTSITSLQTQLAALGNLSADLAAFREETDGRLAASAAMETLTPSAPGKTTLHLGYGHSGDQSAAGLTIAHRLNSGLPVTIDGGVAVSSGSEVTAKAGIGIEF